MFDRKEYMKEYFKEYYQKNKEKILEYNKRHIVDRKEYLKKYYQEHKEVIKARSSKRVKYNKQWHLENPEYSKEKSEQWRINHPEQYKQYYQGHKKENNEYNRNLYKSNPKHNLNHKIKTAIKLSLRGNKAGRHWEDIVGYTLDDLLKRLKNTIPEGYRWEDFMEGRLHIDHIIPKSVFNYTNPSHTDFKRCWALKNLQLLPAKENLIKNAKLYKPFQPALAI